MKKIGLFSIVLVMVSFLISCEKKKIDEFDASSQDLIKVGKMIITENIGSYPISESLVEPELIPGENMGGNRTCDEVAAAFSTDENPVVLMCGEKIDYDYGSFSGAFPAGLNVTTDGTYVSFEILGGCLDYEVSEGVFIKVKVGAVIVKGSDQANVYFYPNGTMGDSELGSPINASGGSAGLSNLTFCFVECGVELPELVIAFKAYNTSYNWVCSGGGLDWNYFIGYYDFVPSQKNIIWWYGQEYGAIEVGNIEVADFDGDNKWEVKVDNISRTSFLFSEAYLFVGKVEDFNTNYTSYPLQQTLVTPSSTVLFQLDF